MFEDITYEQILKRMMDRVPAALDKREGSVIYDALAPAAAELMQMYIGADVILKEAFAVTAGRENLVKKAAEFGVDGPKPATKAVILGEFNQDVPLGSRFNLEELNYVVTARAAEEDLDEGDSGAGPSSFYRLECETPGKGGNKTGTLLPIDYVDGLTSAAGTKILEEGLDEEDTEDFRDRLLFQLQRPATSGNADHYRQWAREVAGVGDALVLPLHQGPGTVKVLVVDEDRTPAKPALLDEVFAHIEEERPIGVAVTVDAPEPLSVNIAATVEIVGQSLNTVKEEFVKKVTEYLYEILFEKSIVSIAVIGSLLLSVEGVRDYSGLTLNGGSGNLEIVPGKIPVLEAVTLSAPTQAQEVSV